MTFLWPNQSSASLTSAQGDDARTCSDSFRHIHRFAADSQTMLIFSQAVQLRAADSAADAASQCVRPTGVCARYSGQSEQHQTSVHPHGL